mmetsp:Transcript_122006/g.210944  ORF Transcript_122006/g.210944 Transcript_122006/m.210944 type:complete len:331 (+) Transcript_122006:69-1061(+)
MYRVCHGERFGPGGQLGKYWVGPKIAAGARGSVYYASDASADCSKPNAAVKHPATNREVRTMTALHDGSSPCLGVPLILDTGKFGDRDKPFVVTELLGAPLMLIFQKMALLSPRAKWEVICIIGRLLLRRLQAIHERGFVHCDINPTNVLMGRRLGAGTERCMPFFIDFGLAHPHPGGDPIQPHAGTIEYNSIRSGDGGPRLPCDDLEALGWMLLHGLCGRLPWFSTIASVSWSDKPRRAVMVKQVQQIKADTLESGLAGLQDVPEEMVQYLMLCRSFGGQTDDGAAARPDYAALAQLLGDTAPPAADESEKEKEDLNRLAKFMLSWGGV